MWSREELKGNAKQVLSRSYWMCLLVCVIVALVCGEIDFDFHASFDTTGAAISNNTWLSWNGIYLPSIYDIPGFVIGFFSIFVIIAAIFGFLLQIFVFGPLKVGKARFFLNNVNENTKITDIVSIFGDHNYLNIVKIIFIRDIKLILWTLCLVFPGIYKSYEYYMIPYLLAQDSSMPIHEVFKKTKVMMDNQRLDVFVLNLSFIGWRFLGSLLFGIGQILVEPYEAATDTELYLVLKQRINDYEFYDEFS